MKKPKKKLVVIIAIVVVLVLLAVGFVRCSTKAVEEISAFDSGVLVEPLTKHDLSSSISVTGTIESQEKSSVTSDLTYKISQLNVQVGDYVNVGDVLCVFDATELEAQIKSLENQLNSADALSSKQNKINNRTLSEAVEDKDTQLQTAQNQINDATNSYNNALSAKEKIEQNYNDCQNQIAQVSAEMASIEASEGHSAAYLSLQEQLSELTATSGTLLTQLQEADSVVASSKQVLDEANANYSTVEKTANRQIQAAQDTIDTQDISSENDEAKKELETLKRKLDKITVKAEHSGIITSLNISTGSLHTGGELMTIQNTNALKLKVSIKETDILNLKEGMRAVVTSNANEELKAEGTVSKVVDFASADTSAANPMMEGTAEAGYSAEITLPENCGMLLGMGAKAKIYISEEQKALAVAYDSIIEDDDKTFVYKATPSSDGKYQIEKVEVKKGADSTYYTGITSDELKEDDYIVSYPDTVNEGDIVDIDETYLSNEDGE